MGLDPTLKPPDKLFDRVRKRWVVATPEEFVRQHAIEWLIKEGGYDLKNMIVEKTLPLGFLPSSSTRRLDLGYLEPQTLTESGRLWLLMECKASITHRENIERAKRQLLGYQWEVPSFAVALVSDREAWYALSHDPENWIEGLPMLKDLKHFASQKS